MLIGCVLLAMGTVMGVAGCSDPGGKLDSPDADVRLKAIHELARQGTDAAVQKLAEAARHEDAGTASEAVVVLGRVKNPQAGKVLAEVVAQEKRVAIRQAAIMAIAQRNEPESAAVLRQMTRSDPAPEVRGEAAAALGKIGTPDDADLLVKAAAAENDPVVTGRHIAAIEKLIGVKFPYDSRASAEERADVLRRVQSVVPELIQSRKGQRREQIWGCLNATSKP